MAKLSLINREVKRSKLAEKYAKKIQSLKETISSGKTSADEKMAARLELQKLPRNSSTTRQRNRCALTGRPRGVFRRFGLARSKIREVAMRGEIPGLTKASW